MACESQGATKRLCIDTALPFDSNSLHFEFLSESITKNQELIFTNGVTGSRARYPNQRRIGTQAPSGELVFVVNRALLDNFLPFIFGGSESSNEFTYADTLPNLYIGIETGIGFQTLNEATCASATFRKGANNLLELAVSVEAESLGDPSGSFPSIAARSESKPYHWVDFTAGSSSIGGASRSDLTDFSITIDNQLETGDFVGQTRDETLCPQDMLISGSITLKSTTDNTDLWGAGSSPTGWTIVFTNAEETSSVLTFALGSVMYMDDKPQVQGRQSIPYQINFECHESDDGNTPALTITNAHT